jgi:putative phage-type endonuclease
MDDVLAQWLLDNRPYTHLGTRVRQFLLTCRALCPALSYTVLKRTVAPLVERLMLGEVGRLWLRDRAFERVLRLYGQNDQRSDQWHAKRGEMITASEVYKLFGSEEARREVLLKKLEPPTTADAWKYNPIPALVWGTRFEPVAKKLYEEDTQCTIHDVSCVQHPVYPFLGASPDGLIVPLDAGDARRYGRLVEFKCPMSRVEKPEIPIAYIHQMQMQMECTGIDECEYVEFRFKQLNYNEWAKSELRKGAFGVYDDGRVVYDVESHTEDMQVVYWVLQSMKKDFVPKDPQWLSDHLPQLQSFWDMVITHRTNGTRPNETKLPTLEV